MDVLLKINPGKNKYWIFLFLLLFLSGLSSCGDKKTNYLYHDVLPLEEKDNSIYPLSYLNTDKRIDVLMVMDNSQSMENIHNNVIANAELFFEQFVGREYVDWKLGIVSTNVSDAPYLGFDRPFSSSLIDPDDPASLAKAIHTFSAAIRKLGINGSTYEYVFHNAKRALDNYGANSTNPFLRRNAHLVVIMISDEPEQSEREYGALYRAANFYEHITQYIEGDKVLRFYGALEFRDLQDCGMGQSYAGSPFQEIIDLSDGMIISACSPKFGVELAKIGRDIVSIIGNPSLLLKRRPKVETLEIYYKGKLLEPEKEEDGGFWFYDEEVNTINFYDVDFVEDIKNDHFRIEFEVDDGVNRDE